MSVKRTVACITTLINEGIAVAMKYKIETKEVKIFSYRYANTLLVKNILAA